MERKTQVDITSCCFSIKATRSELPKSYRKIGPTIRNELIFFMLSKLHFGKNVALLVQILQRLFTDNHGRRKDFFQGGILGDFSKKFLGMAKSSEVWLFPLETIRKQPFLLKFSYFRVGRWPPCNAHAESKHLKITTFYALLKTKVLDDAPTKQAVILPYGYTVTG